jgi:nucleotide-binding universal stress UspA family protein
MTGPILVAVAGPEPRSLWDHVRELLPGGAEVELLHVVDDQSRFEMGVRAIYHPGRIHPPDIESRAALAEQRGAEAILAEARDQVGLPAEVEVRTLARIGRPEREIVARAAEIGASLVVICARAHTGQATIGPASVGHVARFVVDHAPCPVLVIRG